MTQVELEGRTLGQKHRYYNKIVKESIANPTKDALKDIDFNEDDVYNLIKVDMASMDRNVDYILGILKSNDMLYVSRAIKQCPWLITDSTHAHIINPEYLNSQMAPVMMPKAFNKLILHIRLSLRDETRIENFFNYYEDLNLREALKWLPHCSVGFMEAKVEKYWDTISARLLKRLCEKSHLPLEVFVRNTKSRSINHHFQATLFLLHSHTDFYLDLVETRTYYEFPQFNSRMTKILMKACPERINKNFSKYACNIHIPTFVKTLHENKIKYFLLTQANLEKERYSTWMNYDNLQHFIRKMPQEQRLIFIRDVFANKRCKDEKQVSENYPSSSDSENDNESKDYGNSGIKKIYKFMKRFESQWYMFLPFDVVLTEFKEKMKNNTDEGDRNNMLECLIRIVGRDIQHLEALLQYYNDNHLKAANNDNRNRFVKNLLKHTNVLNYGSKCWSLLTNIFIGMNIYNEQSESDYSDYDSDEQVCIIPIIVHEVINKKEVPEIIEKRFQFDSLTEYQGKMNTQEKTLLFTYLYNYMLKKIEKQNFQDETNFEENSALIHLMLKLLKNWQNNLADYPHVLNKIRELIKTNQENSLKVNISRIYNMNKSWRKCMFEESIILCASEEVCINALKHDPNLLSSNENVITAMRSDNNMSLKRLLMKIKVYWHDSFASEWSQAYREKLNQPLGHKALMRGLSFLLPQRELSEVINVYKPNDAKINWEKNDEILISLRKHIAMNMHLARPQPTPNHILQYAKGDYLQFALPSLNAIFYNLCAARCKELIPKLLDSPVSLQKHGIRIAFTKLQSEDLQKIFCDYWKTVKNLSIRAVIFKLAHGLLCKEKNPAKVDNIWDLLEVFIDGLTSEEDKTIYERLAQVQNVPLRVRHLYVMKSYTFFKYLIQKTDLDKTKYEQELDSLINIIDGLIESMEPEFVCNILQEYYVAVYTKDRTDGFVHRDLMPLMASYLSCSGSEEVQTQRYKTVLLPVLKYTFAVWAEKDKNDIVKTNLKVLLVNMRRKLKNMVIKNMIAPVAMYYAIKKDLQESLVQNAAYIMLTEWKLTAAFTKVVNDSKVTVDRSNFDNDGKYWDAVCIKAAPQFGKMCLVFLKEDIRSLFPSIDEYFSKALGNVLEDLLCTEIIMEVLKYMLAEEVIQSYLVAIRILPTHCSGCEGESKILLDLHKMILSHPSLEVKMHFYHKNIDYKHKRLN